VRVDLAGGEQSQPQYLAINPKSRVPALATDAGIITENPAILAYVAQTYPESNLAPVNDPFKFAKVQAFNNYLSSTVHVAHAHKGRGYRWADEETSFKDMQRKVPQTVAACFSLIEREMLVGPWVMGDTFTICDGYLFTIARWLEGDGVDIDKLPAIRDHRARVGDRAAVKKVLEQELAPA
jgi:glutathione S-transferase